MRRRIAVRDVYHISAVQGASGRGGGVSARAGVIDTASGVQRRGDPNPTYKESAAD